MRFNCRTLHNTKQDDLSNISKHMTVFSFNRPKIPREHQRNMVTKSFISIRLKMLFSNYIVTLREVLECRNGTLTFCNNRNVLPPNDLLQRVKLNISPRTPEELNVQLTSDDFYGEKIGGYV